MSATVELDGLEPLRAHGDDAGYDLVSRVTRTVYPGERATIATGIRLAIPEGWAGLIVPRSGLAAKHGVTVLNAPGLIDPGYRGEVKVLLINHGAEAFRIHPGDRIAQLVMIQVMHPTFVSIEVPDGLGDTARGANGFGSTGVAS